MAYPVIYDVTYSYTGFQEAQGDNSFPGTQIDADLAGLQASIESVDTFMQSVIRSDGALNNGIVTYDSLSPALQTAGLSPATAWLTATSYAAGKNVIINNNLYRSLVLHTSGVFATDLAAGKWLLVSPLGASSFDALAPTTTRGDLIFRNAAANARLAAGTSGFALLSGGPAADPAWAGFLQSGVGASTRTWQDKARDFISPKDFGAVGNGVVDDTAAINNTITAAAAAGCAVFLGGAGNVYMVSSAVLMRPSVGLVGPGTIIQKAGQNLSVVVDFVTNAAHRASIYRCTIDGNRGGNADNSSVILINIGSVNSAVIEGNTVANGNGQGVYVTTGARPKIRFNEIFNFYGVGVAIVSSVAGTSTAGIIRHNHFISPIGQGAIFLGYSDQNIVSENIILGSQNVGMTVNTAGTTVTWVSGPDFSLLTPGQFITLNAGVEFLIIAIASATSLTVSTALPTLAGTAAAAGPGDLISINASSYNQIIGNRVHSGGAGGITMVNQSAGVNVQKNMISKNHITNSVQSGIGISGSGASALSMFDNVISGNIIANCCQGRGAIATVSKSAIALINSLVLNTFIDGNYIRDDQGGSASINTWLNVSGLAAGSVFIGSNNVIGTITAGITGGLISVTLSAGWGSTASVTSSVTHGTSHKVVVNPAGAGIAANPTVTISTVVSPASQPPVMLAKALDNNGAFNGVFGDFTMTASGMTLTYVATPGAGVPVTFVVH